MTLNHVWSFFVREKKRENDDLDENLLRRDVKDDKRRKEIFLFIFLTAVKLHNLVALLFSHHTMLLTGR